MVSLGQGCRKTIQQCNVSLYKSRLTSFLPAPTEATASVDRATDALIQGAVRRFASSRLSCDHISRDDQKLTGTAASSRGPRVLLVIAHRIDTIVDMDRVMVLGAGKLLEEGSPAQLSASGGLFASMVSASKVVVPGSS